MAAIEQFDLSGDFPDLRAALKVSKGKKKSKKALSLAEFHKLTDDQAKKCIDLEEEKEKGGLKRGGRSIINRTDTDAISRPDLKSEIKASLEYMNQDIFGTLPSDFGCMSTKRLPDPNDPAQRQLQLKMMQEKARKSLEYYKDTKGEECELVEIEAQEAAIVPPYNVYHLTFTAKPKNSSSPKLFFAEIYQRWEHLAEKEVKMCLTLDDCGAGVRKGCGYLQGLKDMPHPKDVIFFAGPHGSPIIFDG